MHTHHFTLIIEGPDMQEEAIIDALFKNGCDDGTIGRSGGVQFIVFAREAASFVEAVQSAIDDIERIQGLKVVRVTGDNAQQIAKFIPKNMLNERAKTARPNAVH